MYFHITYQDPPKLLKKYKVGYIPCIYIICFTYNKIYKKYEIYFIPYTPYNKLILKKTLFN